MDCSFFLTCSRLSIVGDVERKGLERLPFSTFGPTVRSGFPAGRKISLLNPSEARTDTYIHTSNPQAVVRETVSSELDEA